MYILHAFSVSLQYVHHVVILLSCIARLSGGTLTQGAELRSHECKDSPLLEGNDSMSFGDQRVLDTLQSRIFVVHDTKLPNGKGEGAETHQTQVDCYLVARSTRIWLQFVRGD